MENAIQTSDIRTPLIIAAEHLHRALALVQDGSPDDEQFKQEERLSSNASSVTNDEISDVRLCAFAKRLIGERRMCDNAFRDVADFFDPQWDILLDLFVSALTGKQISITSAASGSNVAPTTALRHIGAMVEKGLLIRTASQSDRRTTHVCLSDCALGLMRDLLAKIISARK